MNNVLKVIGKMVLGGSKYFKLKNNIKNYVEFKIKIFLGGGACCLYVKTRNILITSKAHETSL